MVVIKLSDSQNLTTILSSLNLYNMYSHSYIYNKVT